MKHLNNEISVNLAYGPEDIEYEPEQQPTRWAPGVPADAWLKRATVEGLMNDDNKPLQAPQWLIDMANEDAMFCNQLIQEKEKDLREWAEEKRACEAEYRHESLVDAKFCRFERRAA